MKVKLTGYEAIAMADRLGVKVNKYADPTEGARKLEPAAARKVAAEDPGLLWIEVQQAPAKKGKYRSKVRSSPARSSR